MTFWLKISIGFLLASLSGFAGCIPLYLQRKGAFQEGEGYSKRKLILSLLICFGGGVMLATLFIHVIPEITVMIETTLSVHAPVDYLLICGGLFLIYLIEELVNAIAERTHVKQCRTEKTCDHPGIFIKPYEEEVSPPMSQDQIFAIMMNDDKQLVDQTPRPHSLTILRNLLLIIALSLHAFFEGNIIGLENSQTGMWMLFTAVFLHKIVISFCVSVELLAEGASNNSVLTYAFVFALSTFSGIVLGAALNGNLLMDDRSSFWIKIVLQGLSAGALMYSTFFEILQREKAKRENGLLKFFAVFGGFVAMTVVNLLTHEQIHSAHDHK